VFFIGPLARFHGTPMEQIYGYFSCFDQIAIGCITAISFPHAQEWIRKSRYAVLVPSAGAFILAYGYLCGDWRENIVIGPSLIAIGTALLLLGSECPLPPFMRFLKIGAPLVALFGRKSYEIYLFHTVLLAFMWMASAQMKFNLAVYSVLWLLLFLGLSLAVGCSISRWWSEPMNNAIRQGLARRSVPRAIDDRARRATEAGVTKESGSQPSQSARGLFDCLGGSPWKRTQACSTAARDRSPPIQEPAAIAPNDN
jgi:peptidoglycan/LPS O-acetylase OafA/YrhL